MKYSIPDIGVDLSSGLFLIAGPCVIESRDHVLFMASELKKITSTYKVPFVFKASYDKANRTSIKSFRGPGLDEGLAVLREVREKVGVPILSDVHDPSQAEPAAKVLDILQIPAFLSRQTDLILAAARTGKIVNVKKGQFLAPWEMKNVVDKSREAGNERILLTERGASFGASRRTGSELRRAARIHSSSGPGGCGCRGGRPVHGSARESRKGFVGWSQRAEAFATAGSSRAACRNPPMLVTTKTQRHKEGAQLKFI